MWSTQFDLTEGKYIVPYAASTWNVPISERFTSDFSQEELDFNFSTTSKNQTAVSPVLLYTLLNIFIL